MKVNLNVTNNFFNRNKVSFEGYKISKNDRGLRVAEFAYPCDTNVYNCYLEVFSLEKKDNYKDNYNVYDKVITTNDDGRIYMPDGKVKVDIARTFGISDNEPFAYHYIIERKDGSGQKAEIDAGLSIDERTSNQDYDTRIYNIVPENQSLRSRGGAMKLINIDAQHVGIVYNDKGLIVKDKSLEKRGYDGVKSLTNHYGGTLAGLEKAVENNEYDGYSEILTLPVTAQKDVYWTENLFQIDQSVGSINNYSSLLKKLFAKRINMVSDGAFVNEGLTGIHLNHMFKWGQDSPYYRWFKARSLQDNTFSLGILPKNKENVSFKLVNYPMLEQNSKGIISEYNRSSYDKTKPTYINFLDKRLVNDEQKRDTKNIINMYSKMNTERFYDLTTHNDSVYSYALEIKPEHIKENIKRINEYNRQHPENIIKLDSYKAAKMLAKSENWTIDEKFESGFETWDANPDIAKLSFVMSNNDAKSLRNLSKKEQIIEQALMRRGNYQVRDYTVDAGKFWTKMTNDILTLYTAQSIGSVKNLDKDNSSAVYQSIINLSDGVVLPKSVKYEISEKEVRNVLNGFYLSKREFSKGDKNSQILEGLMNTPLDSIELGNNLTAVLASPLISKRASTKEEIGQTRYNLFRAGDINLGFEYRQTYSRMNNIYQNEMMNFAQTVLDKLNSRLPENNKIFEGDKVTEYGGYVLPLILPQIVKYAVIKGFSPKSEVKINPNNGEITYNYRDLKNISLQKIGVLNPENPEDEANMVLSVLTDGLKDLGESNIDDMIKSISLELKDTDAKSFALADLIIDKTQSGLNWRIDATKDIADIESLRNHQQYFEQTWQEVTDFWKDFSQGVLKYNPNSYLVAEITMVSDLFLNHSEGSMSEKYKNRGDIMQKFFRETGITAEANYEDYFYNIAKMFSKSFEDGTPGGTTQPKKVSDKIYNILISNATQPLLKTVSLPAIMYTYSFVGNHDKPRALHCAALDMGMFYADLNNNETKIGRDFRKTAYRLLNDKYEYNKDGRLIDISDSEVDKYRFDAVSPKAVAMGLTIRKNIIDTLIYYRNNLHIINNLEFNEAYKALSKSVSDLSRGYYKNYHFEPDSFGVKPIDANIEKVIEHAKDVYGLKLPKKAEENISSDVFERILAPALSKLLGMMKYLVALPGMPTMYDGDDYGTTGYDSETKNMYLSTRSKVHEEWVKEIIDGVKNPRFKPLISQYKKYFDDVMKIRTNPKCNALNNGAPFMLPVQNAKRDWENDYDLDVPAILRQSTDGRMTISLFNPVSKNKHMERYDFDHEVSYAPDKITLDSIKLNFTTTKEQNDNDETYYKNTFMDGSLGVGIKGLKEGLIFHNALDDSDTYIVNKNNEGMYYLKRTQGDGKIRFEDTTLNLYYVPDENKLSFTGKYNLKTPKIVSNLYLSRNETAKFGEKLCILKG